jgi:hypothetical protein
MTRAQLEHVIRAAADIADAEDIVVIGSQAILGQFPNAPASMRVSAEADVYPLHHPERADLIDGSIGELSPFHNTYGYYAQGVSETTADLPRGWKERLIVVQNENTRGARGLCLEVHDLLAAKSLAGREKDIDFLTEAAAHGLADEDELLARLALVNASPEKVESAKALVRRVFLRASNRS